MGPLCTARTTPDESTNTVLGTPMRPYPRRNFAPLIQRDRKGEPELVDEATDVVLPLLIGQIDRDHFEP